MNGPALEIRLKLLMQFQQIKALSMNTSSEISVLLFNSFAVCYLANIAPSHSFWIVNYNAVLSITFFNFLLAETIRPCLTVLQFPNFTCVSLAWIFYNVHENEQIPTFLTACWTFAFLSSCFSVPSLSYFTENASNFYIYFLLQEKKNLLHIYIPLLTVWSIFLQDE